MDGINFQMPESIEIEDSTFSSIYGKFVIQPLERGYGYTLGNAVRRILLASLPGAAISAIKIDGVLHEFSTIPGVVEDVVEIVLNLKQIRLKLLNKKLEKIKLHLKGPMIFTAETIQRDSIDLEILNPDQHIAALNEEADFSLELMISKGRGFVSAEENRHPDLPIGTIPIDSVFTPIKNVNIVVENMRVGQKIDFEKLIVEIFTDGSMTPDDALTYAGKLLRDHIQLLINFDLKHDDDSDDDIDEETLRIRKLLKEPVDELELSVRSANCLNEAKIRTIGDLIGRDEPEMLKFKNFGRKSLQELNEILRTKGLSFGFNVEKYLSPSRRKLN
ncbi:DNA-directed RNA polymerase subunit alpha [bacterium]|nr:DNA-directed RNA polymerase subunit alpha [FCB group bacterium]MBL7191556.1 DNA-directed RNA polymerase subunit alpha [bacterium]